MERELEILKRMNIILRTTVYSPEDIYAIRNNMMHLEEMLCYHEKRKNILSITNPDERILLVEQNKIYNSIDEIIKDLKISEQIIRHSIRSEKQVFGLYTFQPVEDK